VGTCLNPNNLPYVIREYNLEESLLQERSILDGFTWHDQV